jgi:hypothetical protein
MDCSLYLTIDAFSVRTDQIAGMIQTDSVPFTRMDEISVREIEGKNTRSSSGICWIKTLLEHFCR